MSDDGRLGDIEKRIAALDDPSALLRAIDDLPDLAARGDEASVRLGIARGIVLNRLGLPESALKALQQARALARDIGATALHPAISRETSRIHIWRGETASAALELMRSVVEADAAGNPGDTAAAVVEFGRLNLDTGRYEAALDAFALAAGRIEMLPGREESRLPVNQREALLALGRYDECLDGIDAMIAALPAGYGRDNFVARVIKARCLAAVGRDDEARAAEADARAWVGEHPSSYERAELALLEGFLNRKVDPEATIARVERALDRFVDDDLPRHEFDARILLAETLAGMDRRVEAEACIVEALRRAEDRRLPAMADRVRAVAVGFWRPAMIAELSPEDRLSEDGGSGRFLVLETLGAGGFGEVQRAIDLDTGTEVAIKRLRRQENLDLDTARSVMATARNEILTGGRIRSRFVARTRYLHMDSGGGLTLVQDYVAGPTLRVAIDDGAVDFGRKMAIAASIARTLATLHQAGIAHRDLKPDNIVLRHGTQPVIIDLGIARLKGMADTAAGLGTVRYAAPEQLEAATDDRWLGREDVYALGRMIGEMMEDEEQGDRKRGILGRFGWRRTARIDGPLATMVKTMTIAEPDRRDVDLDQLADLLDDAAVTLED